MITNTIKPMDLMNDLTVAMITHYQSSGSVYLHSLLDGHPQIMTIPGVPQLDSIIHGTFKDTEDAIQEAVIQSDLDNRELTQVSTNITKNYYIGLGTVIRLNVDEAELRTYHRVKSKNVSWSKGGFKCSLTLNRADPLIKDYIQSF